MKDKTKHYLFVCYGNLNRSKAAEDICRQTVADLNLPIRCDSAGMSPAAETTINKELCENADIIFVMEEYMKENITTHFGQPAGKIIVLDIPDMYARTDPVLRQMLSEKLSSYLTAKA